MSRRLVAGLTIALLLTVVAGIVFVDSGEPTAEFDTSDLAQTEDIDRTIFAITVFEGGDARWTVEHRQEIPFDSEERDNFEAFAETFNQEETETYEKFQTRAARLTNDGSNLTDRRMDASAFEREAWYDEFNQEGVIQMSFRWGQFAQRDTGQVLVADVFAGGFAILEDQELRIYRGDNLSFDSVEPDPDRLSEANELRSSDWVRWNGPRSFDDTPLQVTFLEGDVERNGQQNGDDSGPIDDDEDEGDSSMMLPLLLAFVVLIGVGGGALWYMTTRAESTPDGSESSAPTASGDAVQGTASAGAAVSQEELLSDEDRVLQLLEENGGRMRQVTIVDETDWSKSKVSMLLSDMEDEGHISKLRVGRENIVSLAGEEPEAAGSPFEDEGE